ncbi:MAG: SDR family NAD(P)-dependent oxidoreductase [Caldilineaceae bacterium]|nr:SDR family NAD(P)-dependent oxidoreductase [Caldilineaceae bacterium]
MHITDNTFLVTGGGSGLGAATARMLVENGGRVVLADINTEAGQAMAGELGERARFVPTDVTAPADVEAALDAAEALGGTLRGAINCAGIVIARRTLSKGRVHDLESFARVVQVNLIGAFNVCRLAAARIAQAEPGEDGERGVLVNTASIAAYDGQMGQAAYASSKGGVVGLTLPLARDLARDGIRVMTIAPGIFETPMMAALPQAAQESLARQVPFPSRLGRPSEYAATVKYILETRMVNGEVIRLDGAIRMGPS